MPNENDPNKSKGSSTVNRLEELGRRYTTRSVSISAEQERIEQRRFELEHQLGQLRPKSDLEAKVAGEIYNQIKTLEGRYKSEEATRMHTANKLYVSGIESALKSSNVKADINAIAGSTSVLGIAAANIKKPTYELEEQQQMSMVGISDRSSKLRQAIRKDPTNKATIEALQKDLENSIQGTAISQATLDLQKKGGIDIRSRYLGSLDRQNRLGNILYDSDIEERVKSGAAGTRKQAEETLKTSAAEISKVRAEQEKTTDPKKFEELQVAIEKLTQSAEGATETLKEMKRQGRGGGWGDRIRPYLEGGVALAGLGSNLVDTWSYQNPLRERQNQIRYAQIANRQFDDTRAAFGGDMGSLRRLMGGAYDRASQLNTSTKAWSRGSTALDAAAGIGSSALKIGTGIPGMNLVGAIGIGNTVNNAAANWNQQAGERGSQLSAVDIQRGDVLNHVNDETTQAFVDFSKSMGAATVGAGSRRSALFSQMNSPRVLQGLADVGIGADRAASLTGMAVGALGGQFNNVGVIQQAGRIERGGYMGAEQYFQSLGKMSNVGGNAQASFQEILKNAVATGMDNSKNISQMVDATTSLSERSARMGIDVSGMTGELMGRAVGNMNDVPINMRVGAAAGALDFANRAASDQGLNLATIQEQSRINKFFPGASNRQRITLGKLTEAQTQILMGGGPEAIKLAEKAGIDDLYSKKDFSQNMEFMKREKVLTKLEAFGMTSQDVRQQIMTTKDLTRLTGAARREFMGATFQEEVEGGALAGMLGGRTARKGIPKIEGEGEVRAVDELKRIEAEGQRRILEDGRRVVGSLDNVTVALREVVTKFEPAKMGEAVSKAAENFAIPVKAFDAAVTRLVNKLDVLDNRSKKAGGN